MHVCVSVSVWMPMERQVAKVKQHTCTDATTCWRTAFMYADDGITVAENAS